jgi:hypothetical protein
MNAVFYRFDGDTLTGRFLGELVATRKKTTTIQKLGKDIGALLSKWG